MCPFDQLHAIFKDCIMLLHNRQRKKEARESSGRDDQKGENGQLSEVEKKYIVHHQNKVQA